MGGVGMGTGVVGGATTVPRTPMADPALWASSCLGPLPVQDHVLTEVRAIETPDDDMMSEYGMERPTVGKREKEESMTPSETYPCIHEVGLTLLGRETTEPQWPCKACTSMHHGSICWVVGM